MQNKKDEELIDLAKNGNSAAFDQLSSRHWDKIYGVAYKFVKNQDDAEEIVQDTLLKAYIHLNKFQGQSTFATWAHRIAVNTAKNFLSTRNNKTPKESITKEEIEADYPDHDDPEEQLHVKQAEEHLNDTVSKLPDDLKEVFLLSDYHLINQKEIAEKMDLQEGTVKSRLSRAREIIHGKYKRWRNQ